MPKLDFGELLTEIQIFMNSSRTHMREPRKFREDQLKIKEWFKDHGVDLQIGDKED